MWQMSWLVWSVLPLSWLPLPSGELILSQVLSAGGCSELFTWDKHAFNDAHFPTSLTLAKQRETETEQFQSWMHAQQPGSLTHFRGLLLEAWASPVALLRPGGTLKRWTQRKEISLPRVCPPCLFLFPVRDEVNRALLSWSVMLGSRKHWSQVTQDSNLWNISPK